MQVSFGNRYPGRLQTYTNIEPDIKLWSVPLMSPQYPNQSGHSILTHEIRNFLQSWDSLGWIHHHILKLNCSFNEMWAQSSLLSFTAWMTVSYYHEWLNEYLNNFCVQSQCHVQPIVTPWTVAHQSPLSMGFSRQEYWSGLPFPSPLNNLICDNFTP